MNRRLFVLFALLLLLTQQIFAQQNQIEIVSGDDQSLLVDVA